MSHSASLTDYRTALTTPGARLPVLASVLARLPIAMISLALLLYVQHATGSFASGGLTAAAALVGVAIGSVVQGRVMDRLGPTRPLLVLAVFAALFAGAEVYAIESHAPELVVIALALGIGLTELTVGSASRALWVRLLPPGPARQAAYAYEAISMEVFFILGPGLAGLLAALPWAGTGLVAGSACMIVGAVAFALTPTVRAWRPTGEELRPASLLGALVSPGMRVLVLAALGFGMVIGFVEVAVPAFAAESGQREIGGVMLSLWSISSVIFGVYYGARPWPRALHLRLPVLLTGFAVLVLLLALPTTLFWLGAALLVVGTMITPQATTHSVAIEEVAPAGTATEAFGWVVTAITLGLAIGQSVSGQLVELVGPRWSFVAASAAGLVIAALLWAFRGAMRSKPLTTAATAELVTSR
ncbi:MFS transporter [Kutzneria viridogrisea]|uniref:Arabinose efflux permease family protein n=2 Tax=Kutzneria TaxID=43356 RepID=W5VZ16_9PSEU|nr:MFS transporter [Kutzneria albida]AHH93680.1 arabinose efflux permease family protein [Kutzneria albida DSM 43870]MBA8931316.1 MFS family permease [Kutzneria viridogrisea]